MSIPPVQNNAIPPAALADGGPAQPMDINEARAELRAIRTYIGSKSSVLNAYDIAVADMRKAKAAFAASHTPSITHRLRTAWMAAYNQPPAGSLQEKTAAARAFFNATREFVSKTGRTHLPVDEAFVQHYTNIAEHNIAADPRLADIEQVLALSEQYQAREVELLTKFPELTVPRG